MRRALYILISAAAVLTAVSMHARRAKMKSQPVKTAKVEKVDTLRSEEGKTSGVTFSGYDKPASADRETFFATNTNSLDTLKRFTAEIEYRTTDNRQLHVRKIDINCDIPPGQTRLINIQTWDKAHSFRYFRSRDGRNPATPYQVHITLQRCWFSTQ